MSAQRDADAVEVTVNASLGDRTCRVGVYAYGGRSDGIPVATFSRTGDGQRIVSIGAVDVRRSDTVSYVGRTGSVDCPPLILSAWHVGKIPEHAA